MSSPRALFSIVQYIDGFVGAQPNADVLLPEIMREAGLSMWRKQRSSPPPAGSISLYCGRKPARPPRTDYPDGIDMHADPYRIVMGYKRWATNDPNAIVAGNITRLDAFDRDVISRLLDHVQTADEIFRGDLEVRGDAGIGVRSKPEAKASQVTGQEEVEVVIQFEI